jgi:hypothetical protein
MQNRWDDVPDDCADCLKLIAERDAMEAWADKLASAIAKRSGADIGEHTSHNNPWANALALIEST